jgi:hypothetical protein
MDAIFKPGKRGQNAEMTGRGPLRRQVPSKKKQK